MKIVIISDTHGKHKQLNGLLPDGDMIIHCGDFTTVGHDYEIVNFMKWFSNLNQFKYKICIAGNHDRLFELNGLLAKSLISANVIYLEDSGIEIEGKYFYGTPVQKPFFNWAFNKPEEKLKLHWEAIPDNTDVLITHDPPYGIFDYAKYSNDNIGSESLYFEVVNRIKPLVHCFGHNHSGHGIKEIDNIKFINASNLDDRYWFSFMPIVIEI